MPRLQSARRVQTRRHVRRLALALTLNGCAPKLAHETAEVPIRMAAIERGRLIAVDETGNRQSFLTEEGLVDMTPAASSDGKRLAFARGKTSGDIHVYVMDARLGSTPRAVTVGQGQFVGPAWVGDELIVAGRVRDQFELFRIRQELPTEPVRLTTSADDELMPAVAPSGVIAFTRHTNGTTQIWERLPDGNERRATTGDADSSPTYRADGALVFARPVVRAKATGTFADSDLWLRDTSGERVLVPLDGTDESGAVFSRDGRYMFFSSVLRASSTQETEPTRLSEAVAFVDLSDDKATVRVLRDSVGWTRRKTPAIFAARLDATQLNSAPPYHESLLKVLVDAVEANRLRQREASP